MPAGTHRIAVSAATAAGSAVVMLSLRPGQNFVSPPAETQASLRRLGATSSRAPEGTLGLASGLGLSVSAATVLGAIAAKGSCRVARQAAASSQSKKVEQSQALPFMPVPSHLTNQPENVIYPGDLGFDPLGFGANDYVNEVIRNFGFDFNGLRWYRESELMHGRVAMLAVFKVIIDRVFPGQLPDEQGWVYSFQKMHTASESMGSKVWEFVQLMAILEAFRGYRLLVNQDQIAGDLGLGSGQSRSQAQSLELAQKQYKELQNGRLAMLAFAGMASQYALTGIPVGLDVELPDLFSKLQQSEFFSDAALTVAGSGMALDGARRLSEKGESSSIASKAINLTKLQTGTQVPDVALPAGVVAGQAPQRLALTEEQVRQFEEDGVIMIKGGMKDWVAFLQGITAEQIDNPHIWSLVGRMSGMYDYIQRNMWMTNDGFRDFLYYSPLGHIASQLGRTDEIRCSTDMLLVNPNRGFGWHQDNQNGPIDFPDAIRWWVAMDRCGEDDFGAPEYLLGSHNNRSVSSDAVFVNLEDGDLEDFSRKTTFIPEPGDLILWNSRTIHRIVAPPNQMWEEGTQRRAIGGTMAKGGTIYRNKGGASGISDLAGHSLKNGELLSGPYFPRIFPTRVPEEEEVRAAGEIEGRSGKKMLDLGVTLASNASKYVSFTKVVGKKD